MSHVRIAVFFSLASVGATWLKTVSVRRFHVLWRRRHCRKCDHDLGRFHDCDRIAAAAKLQPADRISSDHGSQTLIANTQLHLGEQAIDPNFLDVPE